MWTLFVENYSVEIEYRFQTPVLFGDAQIEKIVRDLHSLKGEGPLLDVDSVALENQDNLFGYELKCTLGEGQIEVKLNPKAVLVEVGRISKFADPKVIPGVLEQVLSICAKQKVETYAATLEMECRFLEEEGFAQFMQRFADQDLGIQSGEWAVHGKPAELDAVFRIAYRPCAAIDGGLTLDFLVLSETLFSVDSAIQTAKFFEKVLRKQQIDLRFQNEQTPETNDS